MDNTLIMEKVLNVGSEMTKIVLTENQNELLSELFYSNGEIIGFKKRMSRLFKIFKDTRYVLPPTSTTKVSTNYEYNPAGPRISNSSKVEEAVTKYLDRQTFAQNVYESLIHLSTKLTVEENVYLINTFLTHKSEEDIAEIIGISKTYLQKIKRSCIVKMWIDLEMYCKEENE